jgi:hypothetical protein
VIWRKKASQRNALLKEPKAWLRVTSSIAGLFSYLFVGPLSAQKPSFDLKTGWKRAGPVVSRESSGDSAAKPFKERLLSEGYETLRIGMKIF